jgi:DNA-binding CsgD family transcriptional regulator
MLLGRERERREIERALDAARSGRSTVLGLIGEPGIGKTVLLEWSAGQAADMQVLTARGVESEAQIPFASLLELLRPALVMLDRIPEPQARALESALALRPALAHDRFAVGAATLSLLAAYAESAPLLVAIDDGHWLDEPSAQAILFAVRRFVADPIAVLIGLREDEPSLFDGSDLPRLRLAGLSEDDARALLGELGPEVAVRLHGATAGNPLGLLELATEATELALAPEGAPMLVSARIADAFLRRFKTLGSEARRPLVLAATSDSGDVAVLQRAADLIGVELAGLADAEAAGLVSVRSGAVEFRHPLARSAIYAQASVEQRREAHRALAASLPDRDIDRRAWHLASAAAGLDAGASAALEQAGIRAGERSAYAVAASAFDRAGALAAGGRRAGLLLRAAEAAWQAGDADHALELVGRAREVETIEARRFELDRLEGHIVTRRGPVARGFDILTTAAERAAPDEAAEMLAEAAIGCFFAARPRDMLATAGRAHALVDAGSALRARFVATVALGAAHVIGGDAGAGAQMLREAIALSEGAPEMTDDVRLLPWLALVPVFLREGDAGRFMLAHALEAARAKAALGALPYVLVLVARDQATTDGYAVAEATYREAILLARESGQRTDLAIGLAGLAWLEARRGRQADCRAAAGEALALSSKIGTALWETWTLASLGELEAGLGDPAKATEHFERQQERLIELEVTDPDLSPAPDLVDLYLRLGRRADAERTAAAFAAAAAAKGQPWSQARAVRCRALLAADEEMAQCFEAALRVHEQTLDLFETARTRLAYAARLRRARSRVAAREQLRLALDTFERLDARPWADQARAELAASGETMRRRDVSTIDELTPQELQISLLLAAGKTTREAAASLFLSPKTIEYHLRHVYLKLGIHSREELADRLASGEATAAMI